LSSLWVTHQTRNLEDQKKLLVKQAMGSALGRDVALSTLTPGAPCSQNSTSYTVQTFYWARWSNPMFIPIYTLTKITLLGDYIPHKDSSGTWCSDI